MSELATLSAMAEAARFAAGLMPVNLAPASSVPGMTSRPR